MSSNRMIFVNLPVKNLKATMEFFATLGFKFNPQFTNENAACMVVSENAFVLLLKEEFFKSFSKKEITDAAKSAEVIVSLSAESKEEVDELANKALAAGAMPANEAMEGGPMYVKSFQDLDGHVWEVVYMDPEAINRA